MTITYRKYNPEKDALNEGMKIRLAGREGRLANSKPYHEVYWDDRKHERCHYRDLRYFPDLEIAEEPLRISKRLKEELREQISAAVLDTGDSWIGDTIEDRLVTFLNSLEETE